jgi:hypothetical protein
MNYIQIAKDIRKAAKECITEARKRDSDYYVHREVEVVACNDQGRTCDDAFFILLRDVSGKALRIACESLHRDSEVFNQPYTHFGFTGGTDAYESMDDMMKGYDYTPWADTWDLEDVEKGELI